MFRHLSQSIPRQVPAGLGFDTYVLMFSKVIIQDVPSIQLTDKMKSVYVALLGEPLVLPVGYRCGAFMQNMYKYITVIVYLCR